MCAFFSDELVLDVVAVQPSLGLVVSFQGEICAKARHWHTVHHMRDRHVILMREVGDDLAAEEIVINPPVRIDPALLALQDVPVELLRLGEIVGGHGVVEGLIYDFSLHDMNIKMSLLHYVQEGVLSYLHLADRTQLLLPLLVPLQQLLLARVVPAVALRCHVLFYVRDVLLRDRLGSDSSLDGDREQVRRDRFFDLDADVLGVLKGLLLVDEEG